MTKGLTRKEIEKMQRIFCPRDVGIILSKFSKKDIQKAINHPAMQK